MFSSTALLQSSNWYLQNPQIHPPNPINKLHQTEKRKKKKMKTDDVSTKKKKKPSSDFPRIFGLARRGRSSRARSGLLVGHGRSKRRTLSEEDGGRSRRWRRRMRLRRPAWRVVEVRWGEKGNGEEDGSDGAHRGSGRHLSGMTSGARYAPNSFISTIKK